MEAKDREFHEDVLKFPKTNISEGLRTEKGLFTLFFKLTSQSATISRY